ncbi:ATPase, partial [Bifidobacterium leontopitheci]
LGDVYKRPPPPQPHFRTIPVADVRPGDVLTVLPGETVPVDGVLLSGTASLDMSTVNGEPVPGEVFAGATVLSGAVNGPTALTMRATKPAADSQYQQIMKLVESAQESRPAVVRTADRLAVPFTILSLAIGALAWTLSGSALRFAQVLVLATPCPLLIAAPVAYIAGTGRLAKAGIVVKSQSVLETLGRVRHVFFDKTGTLTVKRPQVVRVEMLPDDGGVGAAGIGANVTAGARAAAVCVSAATSRVDSAAAHADFASENAAAGAAPSPSRWREVSRSDGGRPGGAGSQRSSANDVHPVAAGPVAGELAPPAPYSSRRKESVSETATVSPSRWREVSRSDGGWSAGEPSSATASAPHFDEDHILMMAGVVEGYSAHVLANGIAKAGKQAMRRLRERYAAGQRQCPEPEAARGLGHGFMEYPVVKHVTEIAGKGVSAEVNGHRVRVGRLAFADAAADGFQSTAPSRARFAPLAPDEMAAYVSIDGRLAARIVLRDVPRADARESLDRLRGLGVSRLTMLTGDKRASAEIIAREVGIDDVHAELFPEDKVVAVRAAGDDAAGPEGARGIRAARRGAAPVTMMVGDGVNDAPVLAAAGIGVAITDGTSTAASQSAQVVIMNDSIAAVPEAIAIARRTKRVMLQAVLAGLALALAGMVAAAFNLIPVVVGAFLQEAIDVVSILWALTALLDRE